MPPQLLWTDVAKATTEYGLPLENAEPMHFGHPECTRFVPLLAVQPKTAGKPKLVQFIRDTPDDVSIMKEFFDKGLGGVAFRDDLPLEMAARGTGIFAREPRWMFGRVRRWVNARLAQELGTSFGGLLVNAMRGRTRVDGVTLTSHHFMSPDDLQTDLGKARLEACVFRLPHNGKMVPMCQMNAGGVREQVYAEITAAARETAPTAPAV